MDLSHVFPGCLGLSFLTTVDPNGEHHVLLNGTYLFRVWFLNHPEQAVNITFELKIQDLNDCLDDRRFCNTSTGLLKRSYVNFLYDDRKGCNNGEIRHLKTTTTTTPTTTPRPRNPPRRNPYTFRPRASPTKKSDGMGKTMNEIKYSKIYFSFIICPKILLCRDGSKDRCAQVTKECRQ